MVTQVKPGTGVIRLMRMAWNLNTQQRHLKHKDAPPAECVGWEYNYRYYGYWRFSNSELSYGRANIHAAIQALIEVVESEPNRWHCLKLTGSFGYQTSTQWHLDMELNRHGVIVAGPFCKDRGVLPEFEKDADGWYVLPFNLPEGVLAPYDPNLPDFDQRDREPEKLEAPTDLNAPIVVYDAWGNEIDTVEVIT